MRFFNTLTREEEEFAPANPPDVSMYTCGPTVYNHAHIGNFRAYIFEDLLQRHLESRGYRVRRVMNLTDVDDKTIRGARAAGCSLREFTQPFKEAFFQDLVVLRIKRAEAYPAATEHVERMIGMISQLMESGNAYQADDGSVYFRLETFPRYGCLAHLQLDELRPSGRVRSDEYEKENIGDFALWKARDEEDGDVFWDSPWGQGRPGWHIECSAMATALLGPEIDIHCGGVDNIFPHHEAEIAQSESVTGRRFVRLWMHCRHLLVNGRKMAKSEGNFFTLRDLLDKGWTGREVRFALLAVHYRDPLNFTEESLQMARSTLRRFDDWAARVGELAADAAPFARTDVDFQAFSAALDEDLNISKALAVASEMVRQTNAMMDRGEFTAAEAAWLRDEWRKVNGVLALEAEEEEVPEEVVKLAAERICAREQKNWGRSDALRDQIAAMGWQIKDSKDGQKLSRAKP